MLFKTIMQIIQSLIEEVIYLIIIQYIVLFIKINQKKKKFQMTISQKIQTQKVLLFQQQIIIPLNHIIM